jgi:molecular chaperone GrpE
MPDESRDNETQTASPDAPDSPPDDDSDGDPTPPDPRDELAQERDALQDRLLRTAAEFDNYRKRVDRERRELGETIAADVLTELLPIVDDLERALQAPDAGDASAYRQGVELIHKQMLDLLRKRGAIPLESVGTDFDPRFHQAVTHEVSPDHREGEVIEEFRRGYMLGDRLLRAAMVKVAKA